MRIWQPWAALAGFAFLLHFIWEVIQAPLYTGMADARHWDAVRTCGLASAGDVLVLVTAYAGVAVILRQSDWLALPTGRRVVAYLAIGLLLTFVLETVNVYVLQRWTYRQSMPVLFGIGVSPLMQWVVVPTLTLWLARRHLGLSSRREVAT